MIKLTSLEDLVISLITQALGDNIFSICVYPEPKGSVLFEFYSNDYKFIISRKDKFLRIYNNGNIYLIKNILPENFSQEFDKIIKQEAESLKNYYKLHFSSDKISKDTEVFFYKFEKADLT